MIVIIIITKTKTIERALGKLDERSSSKNRGVGGRRRRIPSEKTAIDCPYPNGRVIPLSYGTAGRVFRSPLRQLWI